MYSAKLYYAVQHPVASGTALSVPISLNEETCHGACSVRRKLAGEKRAQRKMTPAA